MEPRDFLQLLMDESGLNPNSLAARTRQRTKQPQIYRFLKGVAKEPKRSTLEPIAEVFGVPVDAFFDAAAAERCWRARKDAASTDTAASRTHFEGTNSGGAVAHHLSHLRIQDAPTVVLGAKVNKDDLPLIFWAALVDDAMAPRAPAGKLICFDRTVAPKPGDGVLVLDQAEHVHFRQYRAGAAGRWVAAAMNPAYQDLDSERDQLVLVAVLKAEDGRWA